MIDCAFLKDRVEMARARARVGAAEQQNGIRIRLWNLCLPSTVSTMN